MKLQIFGIQERLDFRSGIRHTYLEVGDGETTALLPLSDAALKVLGSKFKGIVFGSRNPVPDEAVPEPEEAAPAPQAPKPRHIAQERAQIPAQPQLSELPSVSGPDDWRVVEDGKTRI